MGSKIGTIFHSSERQKFLPVQGGCKEICGQYFCFEDKEICGRLFCLERFSVLSQNKWHQVIEWEFQMLVSLQEIPGVWSKGARGLW